MLHFVPLYMWIALKGNHIRLSCAQTQAASTRFVINQVAQTLLLSKCNKQKIVLTKFRPSQRPPLQSAPTEPVVGPEKGKWVRRGDQPQSRPGQRGQLQQGSLRCEDCGPDMSGRLGLRDLVAPTVQGNRLLRSMQQPESHVGRSMARYTAVVLPNKGIETGRCQGPGS